MSTVKCIHNLIEQFTTIIDDNYINPVDGKIKWHIVNFTPDMEKYKVILQFENCFKLWAPHFYPIVFESTSNPDEAQIKLHFKNNGDTDLPLDFSPGVLAYAFAPYNGAYAGHIYFNDAYEWGEMHTSEHYYLKKVAVHEAGHTFNIGHTDVDQDIMAPIYSSNNQINITQDSIDAVNYLYGDIKDSLEPTDPEPDPVFDALKRVFSDKKSIKQLNEPYLVALATELGISASEEDLKRDTQEKIFQTLGYN